MNHLEMIIYEVSRNQNLNRESVIDEVKGALQERDPSEYSEWQEDGFNVDHIFYGRHALLHLACRFGITEIIEALIENGANVDALDEVKGTPLYCAIQYGDLGIIETLIENKANINALDKFKNTPLHISVEQAPYYCEVVIIKTLIGNGASVDAANGYDGRTPLHLAAFLGSNIDTVRALIENGADVNAVDFLENTPIHEAQRGAVDVVRILIENGANVNAEDEYRNTPLHKAAKEGALDKVQILIESGADVNAVGYRGNTSLHEAAKKGDTDMIKILIESRANVNVVNDDKQAPLHLAAEHNHLEVVKYLTDKGADLSAKDVNGKVPLDYARGKEHGEVAKCLESKIAEIFKSRHESVQASKEVCGKSLDPETLFGVDSMAARKKVDVEKGERKREKSKCLIQSSRAVNLSLSEFLSPYLQIESVKQGVYLPSFKARNVEIDGKCVSITRGLSQTLFLHCEKSFLSNLKTSAKIYERIAQGKQLSKREEREVFAFSKLLDNFEQQLDSSVNSLPSNLMHNRSCSTLSDLSNYITGVKGDFAIHLVTNNHVVAIYRIGDNYAYFDSNTAFVSGLKSVIEVVEKAFKCAGYKGFFVEHFDVDQANNLLSNEDKKILVNEIKTERQILAQQDKEFGLIKVNGQDISRVQLYDFGTKVSVEGSVPLLINADMNLNSKNFSEYLSEGRIIMTAREYLDSLKNSKNMEEVVQATRFIPFIGSKSEVEKAEQTRKQKGSLAEETINYILSAVSLANIGHLKGQSSADTSTKPDSYLSEVEVDNQPGKPLSF